MTSYRQRVIRADGRAFDIVQHRAHLTYCVAGYCCGVTERGYAADGRANVAIADGDS